jgi:hypothetical protein
MARKITDTWPVIEITCEDAHPFSRREWTADYAKASADQFVTLVKRHVFPHFLDAAHTNVRFANNAHCEHCLHAWTEASTTYNGGCCDKDEDANPEALTTQEN